MQMRAYEVLVDDPLIARYFSDMGFRLVAQSDKPTKPFTFVVLDEPRVNAFAAPGGVVALHSGLILAADDEDEVAGVLAHEIAHITQLHVYRTLQNAQSMTIPIVLGMLAIALAGGGSGDAITGALMGGQAMAQQMYINFTRANESEADRIGITTLSLAGYDPKGMADFFEQLNRVTRVSGEGPPEFLRTHPVNVNRIAEAKNRAANMPTPEASDGAAFYQAQARLRALVEDKPEDAITWFRNELAKPGTAARATANRYGLAIALQRKLQYEEAETLLTGLLDSDPYNLGFQLQMAALQVDTDRSGEALAQLSELNAAFPGNHAITMAYSSALLKDGAPEPAALASRILRQQILLQKEDPAMYELYARSASIAGDDIRASEAMSEAYFRRGKVKEAVEQLEMLIRRDDLDYYQRARVTARLDEMRLIIAEFDDEDSGRA
jgi:predicted Zn-dependent protease